MIVHKVHNEVRINTSVLDALVNRAEKYKAFAENVISALGETFPDAAGVAMRQLEALKKELNDE